MSIAITLRKAAKLQEKIEGLREKLAGILDKARSEIASHPSAEIPVGLRRPGRPKMLKSSASSQGVNRGRGRPASMKKVDGRTKAAKAAKVVRMLTPQRRSPLAGHKRSSSPSGPLAPAVVRVLKSKNKPMNVRDILAALLSGGYKFNSSAPKKNLAARIYRLSGVKQVGPGLFGLA